MRSRFAGYLVLAVAIVGIGWLGRSLAAPPAGGAAPGTRPATRPAHPFRDNVKVEVTGDYFIVHSDGIPDHDTGPFPNAHNPNTIRRQNYTSR